MSVEIAWKQNILVTDSYLLKLLLVVFGFGLQAFVCDFSRQNICSVTVATRATNISQHEGQRRCHNGFLSLAPVIASERTLNVI